MLGILEWPEPVFVLPLRRAGGSPPACGPACAAKESLEEAAVLVVLYVAAVIIDIRVLVALQIGLVFLGLAAGHGLDLLDLGDQLFAGQLGIKGLFQQILDVVNAVGQFGFGGSCFSCHDVIPPEWIGQEFRVFGTAYCSGVIASGLPMRRRNSTAFRCFDSASLRVITL